MTNTVSAVDEIEQRLAPTLAAHKVAQCLDTIAHLLPTLSAEAVDAYLPGLRLDTLPAYCVMLNEKAERTRLAAPVEPVTDKERQEVFEMQQDCFNDMSTRDHARDLLDSFTDADWRYHVDLMKTYDDD